MASGNLSKWWAIVIGSGLALSPIHNVWLTKLATNSKGEVLFFLPAFGYLLLILGAGMLLLYHWQQVKDAGWGDRRMVVPLLVIVASVGLSGVAASGWQDKIAPLGMGLALLATYLTARVLGKSVFLPLAVGAGVASLGIIISQSQAPGTLAGGFVFERNYDIATGYILLGAALVIHRWQWLLACLALVALLMSGSPEALFALGVLMVAVLLRRDWSRRMIIPVVLGGLLVVAGLSTGWMQRAYVHTVDTVRGSQVYPYWSPEESPASSPGRMVSPLKIRALTIKDALTHLKPLGDGYNLTGFTIRTVHNVPLVIAQQLGWPGVLAGLAWLWVSVWCLLKTKWKYVWVLVLSLSVFDHYVWTQLAPWWWAIVGASTATSNITSDLVFRRATE